MIKFLINIFVCMLLFSGCSSVEKSVSSKNPPVSAKAGIVKNVQPPEVIPVKKQKIEEPVVEKGIVFGKTNFQGLLETVYVKLQIESITHPGENYQLLVAGEDKKNKSFPWDVKSVKPGYFSIELPVGEYRLTNIAIPVGTTVAREPMNIKFKVYPHSVSYIGTLKVEGTKEKIHLGGLPVIKPGFEYHAQVLDERAEAIKSMNRYPKLPRKVKFDLMEILLMNNGQ